MPTIARPFSAVLAIAAAITTTKGTVEIVYPPYLAGYGYTLSLIGFLTALIAVLQLISRLPVGVAYHTDRVKRQFALALVVFAISTSGFAFAAGQPLLVAALSVLHGFAFGSLGTLGLALAIDVSGGRRAGVSMAWYTAANSTGYATGALVGGEGELDSVLGTPRVDGRETGSRGRFRNRIDVREYQLFRLGLRECRGAAGGENAGHAGAPAQKRAAVKQGAARGS